MKKKTSQITGSYLGTNKILEHSGNRFTNHSWGHLERPEETRKSIYIYIYIYIYIEREREREQSLLLLLIRRNRYRWVMRCQQILLY